ncbi:MAG: LPS assembly protein LptD [Gammaproteobacteria bacterium]|nr:LPS assembly protein LptD [Gammaproteobacteria bacterium]
MKKLLIFSTLALATSLVHAQGVNLSCYQQQTLFPLEAFTANADELDIEADQSEISGKDDYHFSGNALLRSSEYFLAADDINISKSDQSANATGTVRFQDATFQITSDHVSAQKQDDSLIASIDNAHYFHLESNANGSAASIEKTTGGVDFTDATFTLCPIGNSDWLIKADSISINEKENLGVANSTVIEFLGVPVFYLPQYRWVLEGRGSGFLAPTVDTYTESSNQKSGIQTRIPYYFNLAADRDLLLAFNQLSTRGSVIEGQYRQLMYGGNGESSGSLSIESQYLFNDYITNQARWLLNTALAIDLNDETKLDIKTARASDGNFYQDIYQDADVGNTLTSHLSLSFEDEESGLKANLYGEAKQALNGTANQYTKSFEVSAEKLLETRLTPLDVSVVSTRFSHKDASKTTATRVHGELSTDRVYELNSGTMTTSVFLSTSSYLIDGNSNQSRIIGGFDVDAIFPSQGQATLFGNTTNTTFTPRISYHFVPKTAQGSIPIFDTTDKFGSLLTYDTLFSGQRYSGLDRIANANDITVGFESNYLDPVSGDSLLNVKVAQSYYISDQIVSDTAGVDYETRKHFSDIAASVDLALNEFSFSSAVQFNPSTTSIDNRQSSVSYKANPRNFISLAHANNNTNETLELYGAYPVNESIHLFGGLKKSLTTGVTEKETSGFAYESCCWAVRVAHFKETVNSVYDHSTSLELVFKGLGSSSDDVQKRLEKNIPYYRADLNQ